MENTVSLRLTVPVCGFRRGYAREYLETERVPPPATVYGFLLSLVGEEDRFRYVGSRIACAICGEPQVSVILRTAWRIKKLKIRKKGQEEKDQPVGIGNNKRPDYQEILTGLELDIWVEGGELADRLRIVVHQPEAIDRYGGLSLGESRDLINDIRWFPERGEELGKWLIPQAEGNLTLPVWVDHVGSEGTQWQSFVLIEKPLDAPLPDSTRWIRIAPGTSSGKPQITRSLKRRKNLTTG